MIFADGLFRGRQVLSAESVALMTTDHLTDEQKQRCPAPEGWWQTRGWGMGATVYVQSIPNGPSAGSYSWYGGYGGHFLFDKQRQIAIISQIPRQARGAKDTSLGYQFELDTYRDIFGSES